MKNWRIGTRITAGFAAVIAIAVVLGLMAGAHSAAVSLAQLRHAVSSSGPSIDLVHGSAGADARDRDFAPYQA